MKSIITNVYDYKYRSWTYNSYTDDEYGFKGQLKIGDFSC